jgi:hypothetical protein
MEVSGHLLTERSAGAQWVEHWLVIRASLDAVEKGHLSISCFCLEWNPWLINGLGCLGINVPWFWTSLQIGTEVITIKQCMSVTQNWQVLFMRSEVVTAVNVKVIFLWVVMPCTVVGRYHHLGEPAASSYRVLLLPWRWWQQIPPKHWYLFTRLNGTASQKAVVLIRYLCSSVIWNVIVLF